MILLKCLYRPSVLIVSIAVTKSSSTIIDNGEDLNSSNL